MIAWTGLCRICGLQALKLTSLRPRCGCGRVRVMRVSVAIEMTEVKFRWPTFAVTKKSVFDQTLTLE